MTDLRVQLQQALGEAAECRLIADLATDKDKRRTYERMAELYSALAAELTQLVSFKEAAE